VLNVRCLLTISLQLSVKIIIGCGMAMLLLSN
jgi:hypothetical protein